MGALAFDSAVFEEEGSLLRRARNGDLDAFNALVGAYQGLVYNVCLRMLGSSPAAEDATQEAFVSAWRNLTGLRGAFRPWLMRIASNACTDELRRRGRRPSSSLEVALEEGVPEPPDGGVTPEQHTLDRELQSRLDAALRELPEEQRLAIVLCDIEGFDYTEIAAAMQTSLGTVKSRIARARAKMRETLRKQPELLPARFRLEI
jgi:RNA polymerase sigma-70 factor (ECF subfamily)